MSGGADSVAAVWDLSALACVRACTQLDGEVKTSSVSADSQFLAYAGDQDAVIIESLSDGALQARSVAAVCASVSACDDSRDAGKLAAGEASP